MELEKGEAVVLVEPAVMRVRPPARRWRLPSFGEATLDFRIRSKEAGTFRLQVLAGTVLPSGERVTSASEPVWLVVHGVSAGSAEEIQASGEDGEGKEEGPGAPWEHGQAVEPLR